MQLKKTIDQSQKVLDFGFEYVTPSLCEYDLSTIIAQTEEALIIMDTKNLIFDEILENHIDFVDNQNKKFIGLVSALHLNRLVQKGLKGGFVRSTEVQSNVAILITDKKNVYLALDKNLILKANDDTVKECFDYINHLIWSKSDFEMIQGSKPRKVESIRLSVVEPEFKKVYSKDTLNKAEMKLATENFISEKKLLPIPKKVERESFLIHPNFSSLVIENKTIFVEVWNRLYIPCLHTSAIFYGKSFQKSELGNLKNKKIWFEGKDREIQAHSEIKKTIFRPLDEYQSFQPDFQSYLNEEHAFSIKINLEIEVLPIHIDSTFKKSIRYERILKIRNSLQNSFNDLKKLLSEDESKLKNLDRVIKERDLHVQIKLFNQLIQSLKVGDDSLLNKKDNRFKEIMVNEKDVTVPNEIIGELFEKENQLYLALTSEKRLVEAKEWQKENNEKVILVLKDE